MDNFTLDMLATTGGMAVVAAALVQASKQFLDVNPKWMALCWSLALNALYVLVLATERTAAVYVTAALNVPFVAVAASGAYEYGIKALQNKLDQRRETKTQGNSETGDGESE